MQEAGVGKNKILPHELYAGVIRHFEYAVTCLNFINSAKNLPCETRLDYLKQWEAELHNELLDIRQVIYETEGELKE